MKTIKTKKAQNLGKLTISATGLRRMANGLQKNKKTKGNVLTECYVEKWTEDGKIHKTLGIKIK